MNHWLVKSEPDVWSWQMHVKKGVEPWGGVRSFQARNNLAAMKLGDLAFFYHSNIGREIVGILEVVSGFKPDPADETGKFGLVDFRAVKPLARPVTLAEIKETPSLKDMALVRLSRLSVSPVTPAEWREILKLSGTKP